VATHGTYAALLRAVNLGPNNRVPMGELRSSLAALGLEDVATYVQSGNAVFRAGGRGSDGLARCIERRIAADFGLDVAVLLRTRSELERIVGANPFLDREENPVRLHVAFMDRAPARGAVAELDPERSPPDAFAVRRREIYLHFPGGSGRSKLTIGYFEKRLGVRATARNWKTVTKLLELTRELEGGAR
jgi:uncharacterized protein (DUF1697 family)